MGHDKLRKFAENETFSCLLQPSAQELLADGYFHLRDHAVKGRWNERFGNDHPIVLELGCGKGEYTIALAQRDSSRNYIGVDIKGARLWKGAKYATEHALPNVAFLRTRVEFITAFFAPGEVSEIWLTFSDPQIRSENSRLCSPLFLERYRQFLRPGGIVHLKTDSRFLHEYARAVCAANGLEVLACTTDLYGSDPAGPSVQPVVREVQTFYEQLFLEQGYPITYLAFKIDHGGPYQSPRDPEEFDSVHWRSVEGPRLLFGHDSAETRRQKIHAAGSGKNEL
ncbi:MAG: tRNA (guanosine(46)-N7)-methyltransferase TrmB [Bacteroidales bacterium]|nr:tRNA (guanosine(46)-N7)-methyltransferase TrmB [Bacteroidales bacterium]